MNTDQPAPMLFHPGRIVSTPGAREVLTQHPQLGFESISRHVRGDWGDVNEADWKANDDALRDGSRIFSAYLSPDGDRIWVITEADRTATTFLLPEEY